MFGLFKKKPANALEALIFAIYGNPPPPKRAELGEAIELAHEHLLMELVDRQEVTRLATELNNGPIPYSTNDLAISVALHFFKNPDHVPRLRQAQMLARLNASEWLSQSKVAPLIVKSFEDVLYKLYMPVS